MKATLVVAAREIAERKLLFLGAFIAGILPLTLPLIPLLRGNSRDARALAVVFGAGLVAVTFPIVFGTTMLVSDIAQKRLAFYFSKSLSAASIWGGKLLAAVLISAGCATLAFAPVYLLEGGAAFFSATAGLVSDRFFLVTLVGIVLLSLLSHTVASMARLRSAWVVLDFVLAIVFAVAIPLALRSLFFAGFWSSEETRPEAWLAWRIAVPAIVVLLVASYVQVADGRTDTRRSHGALSATLWSLVTLLTLPLIGLACWVFAATAKDIAEVWTNVRPAPHGAWVSLSGGLRARGSASASFLYDTASGRSIRRSFSRDGGGLVTFSADGARAAWTEGRFGFLERRRDSDVFFADLTSANAMSPGLPCSADCWLKLSPSGRRLLLLDDGTLAVYDISDPAHARQIAALKREKEYRAIAFVGEDVLRLSPRGFWGVRKEIAPRELEIEEIDLLSKKSLITGHVDRPARSELRVHASADGRTLVETSGKRLTLHDGKTGALLGTLSDDLDSPKMSFLSGRRIVVVGVANGKGVLKIFLEGEWGAARAIDLGPAASSFLGGEIAPGRIAVSLNSFQRNDERSRRAWKLAIVDVTTGAISPGPDGLVPADRFSWWFSPVMPPVETGSPASRLFLDADGALVRLDPESLKQEILLGGKR